jgi:hypothetical protein
VTVNSEVASADENKKSEEGMPKPHEYLEFLITVSNDLFTRRKDS